MPALRRPARPQPDIVHVHAGVGDTCKDLGLADALARAHTAVMQQDEENMEVHVCKHGGSFAWELHRPDKLKAVRYSVPIYGSEEAARSAGYEAMRILFAKLQKKKKGSVRD
jgi:hypothetical protein